MNKIGIINRKAQENANNMIVEGIQGFRNIILSSGQKLYSKKFNRVIFNFHNTNAMETWISSSLALIIKVVSLIIICFILIFSSGEILANQKYFSEMIFFIFVTMNIFKNIGQLNSVYTSFTFCFNGLVNLQDLDNSLKIFSEDNSCKKDIKDFKEKIIIKRLNFSINSNEKILNDINLEIKENSKVAFVGKSGSGKSTLIDLISGFHNDYLGEIFVDKINFKEINKDSWRKIIGYVSQETFIFNDTVKNNLLFGLNDSIDNSQLQNACREAEILDTILSSKDGFDTILGERGIILSGGEKQRLALARLFLKKPKIILLDEATSALDSESEQKVKNAIYKLSEGRTVISVAHRLSTISDYDIIYVLENGQIVEYGSHKELILREKYYHKYFTLQEMEKSIEK